MAQGLFSEVRMLVASFRCPKGAPLDLREWSVQKTMSQDLDQRRLEVRSGAALGSTAQNKA